MRQMDMRARSGTRLTMSFIIVNTPAVIRGRVLRSIHVIGAQPCEDPTVGLRNLVERIRRPAIRPAVNYTG